LADYKSTEWKNYQLCWIALFLIVCLFPNRSNAWDLEENSAGVQVYTRKNEGNNFKEFKGITTIKASLNSIVSLLEDTASYPDWYYNCSEARRLKRISPVEGITWSITKTPWPTDDRVSVVRYKRTQDAKTKIVMIQLESVPNYMEQKSDLTGIRGLRGYWKLSPLKDNKVEVTLQVWVDPGGNIPAWLVNAMVVDMPYHSLLNLQEEVMKPKYKNATGLVEEWHQTAIK